MGPEDLLQKTLRSVCECERLLEKAKEIVVADLETTGFSYKAYAEIIEIGAIRVDTKTRKPIGKFSRLIKPMRGIIPPKIESVTGISTEMVRDAAYFEEVLPEFYDFLSNSVFVAHNARFDFRFLQPYMQRVGRIITNDVVCTCELSKALNPELKKHNLEELCRFYGVEMQGHHRAFNDAMYTASAALRLRDRILLENNSLFSDDTIVEPCCHPDAIGFVDIDSVSIGSAKEYEYSDKRLGSAIFFKTSIGDVYYSRTRNVWGIQRLFVPQNVDMDKLKNKILRQYGTSFLCEKTA